MPVVPGHPNRQPFEGCLTLVDVPSDNAIGGSHGHRVFLSRSGAISALPSLIGMGVCFSDGWAGQDERQKCGVITAARLDRDRLMVEGHIFGYDFPEIINRRQTRDLGMSFELADGSSVANKKEPIWRLTHFTFIGAAILLRRKAAFKRTSFCLPKPNRAAETQE